MKNGVGYLRVSTSNQVGDDKFGIPVQKATIIKYAEKNDIKIVDWFVENGVSGGTLDRPELNRLLNGEVKNPPIECVIVAKTDRVARDIQMYYYIRLSLSKRNLELISVQEDWAEYGPMAGMLEAMVVAFAEFEREMIKTRTSNGRKAKAAKGMYSGGKPPYGYTVIDGQLIVDESKRDIIVALFIERDSGATLASITSTLNDNNIKTAKGAKWYPAQVGYLINNRKFYEGMYKYSDDTWVDGKHEAILES